MTRATLAILVGLASAAAGLAAGVALSRKGGSAPPPAPERKVLHYRDPMNPARTSPVPRKDEMGMDFVPVYEGEASSALEGGRGVRVDPRMAQSSGVREEEVRTRRLTRTIRTVGRVTYDERRLHDVNAKVMGWIEKLYVDFTGKSVRRGDPLLALYSPELVATQEEFLLALRHRTALAATKGGNEKPMGADALVESARRRLQYFDVAESDIRELAQRGRATKTIVLRSPATGYVVEKSVVQGAQVDPGTLLFEIADLSNVWVLADVYEYELPWVAVGHHATVELPYVPGTAWHGRVTYVYPTLAAGTRTVKVRVEARNPAGGVQLKPDMYATVIIHSPVAREAVAIPEQAVIRTGERAVGIVALGEGWFEPRELRLGVTADGWVEVLDGIRAGERIVTSSQFLIDSESNLRSAVSAMGAHEHAGARPEPSGGTAPQGRQGERAPQAPHDSRDGAHDHAGHVPR